MNGLSKSSLTVKVVPSVLGFVVLVLVIGITVGCYRLHRDTGTEIFRYLFWKIHFNLNLCFMHVGLKWINLSFSLIKCLNLQKKIMSRQTNYFFSDLFLLIGVNKVLPLTLNIYKSNLYFVIYELCDQVRQEANQHCNRIINVLKIISVFRDHSLIQGCN